MSTGWIKQRTYRACQGCKEKHIRCNLGSFESPKPPCEACVKSSQSCVFQEGKRRKRKTALQSSSQQLFHGESSVRGNPVSPRQQQQTCLTLPGDTIKPMNAQSPAESDSKDLAAAEIHTGLGAINLLALSMPGNSPENPNFNTRMPPDTGASIGLRANTSESISYSKSTPKEDVSNEKSWQKFKLIRRGIINPQETCFLLDFYCKNLSELIPLLPGYYTAPSHYLQLAINEPVLLGAIIVIASRYTTLEGDQGVLRTERIHFRSWRWVKAMLSSTIWGSASSRTLGTVSAFLLFVVWEIKPSHFAGDVAGDIDDDDFADFGSGFYQVTSRRSGRFDLFAPAFRSNQSAWMMLGNALALAQDLECYGPATHYDKKDSEEENTHVDINIWKSRILYFSYTIDEELSVRLRRTPLLPTPFRQVIRVQSSHVVQNEWWRHNLALVNLVSFARETLYSSHSSSEISKNERQLILFFAQLQVSLSQWWDTYIALPIVTSLQTLCLNMDFQYTRLYAFSFALQQHTPSRQARYLNDKLDYSSKHHEDTLAPYLKETEEACMASLSLVVQDSQNARDLRFAPVKAVLQTVCASVYLIKAMLVDIIDENKHDEISRLIRNATRALRASALDDLHMSLRYASFIDSLLESTLFIISKRDEAGKEVSASLNHNPSGVNGPSIGFNGMEDLSIPPLFNDAMTAQWADENGLNFEWGQSSGFDLLDNLLTQPINWNDGSFEGEDMNI